MKRIKHFVIFSLKIIFCFCFIPLSFVFVYFGLIFTTGDRYIGPRNSPYTIRAKIVEKTAESLRLMIVKHDILIDADTLMGYPSVSIKSVTPQAIKYFEDYKLGQTIIAKTGRSYVWEGSKGVGLLDVLEVEKNRIDPFGVDFSVLFLIFMMFLYSSGVIFLFKKELKALSGILTKLLKKITNLQK